MNAKSCHSSILDPYRAGIEIGKQLKPIDPEIIFLFSSIHYAASPELMESIYDALESEPVIIGNTGDGFYEMETVSNTGVVALGINSNNHMRWHLAIEQNAQQNPENAALGCLQQLKKACPNQTPKFYYLSCDFRMDTNALINAISDCTDIPVIGGSGADDFEFKQCQLYANREVLEDAVVMLAAEGDLAFEIITSNRMTPIGVPGTITKSQKTTITEIDGIAAEKFIEKETGKPLNAVDEGILTLMLQDASGQNYCQRSMLLTRDPNAPDEVFLFGGVKNGDIAQVCQASPEVIISGIETMAQQIETLPFKPTAGIMISCAGRKRVLGNQIKIEAQKIVKGCESLTAFAGFPSFGEFGPLGKNGTYSQTLFHNMTCILLLLGEEKNNE